MEFKTAVVDTNFTLMYESDELDDKEYERLGYKYEHYLEMKSFVLKEMHQANMED